MSKEDKNKFKDTEGEMVNEMMEIFRKSLLCREEAEFNHRLINELDKRHNQKIRIGIITDEEMGKMGREARVLRNRIKICLEELGKLDKKYNELKERVNKYYNKDLSPVISPYYNTY